MTELVLETPEGVRLRFELASGGTRILSGAIDALLFVFVFLSTLLFSSLIGFEPGVMILASGGIVLLVGYWFVSSLLLGGATLGKLLVGTRVCDAQGFAPTSTQLLLRALFVPFEALLVAPFPILFALIALLPRHQRLGDLVAGTVVLRSRAPRAPAEPAAGLRWSTLTTRRFPLDPTAVRALSGADLGYLRELLGRQGLTQSALDTLYRESARAFARRLGRLDERAVAADPRTFLRELFLCLRELHEPEARTATTRAEAGAAARGSAPSGGSHPR
ncbi:MAG: RDD family protein [Planctomycetota bacterium]